MRKLRVSLVRGKLNPNRMCISYAYILVSTQELQWKFGSSYGTEALQEQEVRKPHCFGCHGKMPFQTLPLNRRLKGMVLALEVLPALVFPSCSSCLFILLFKAVRAALWKLEWL